MAQRLSQNLALEFRRKIETGQWVSGQRLPTTRQLAATYQVSANTIQGAFRVLEAHDLVDRRPRRGGFVKGPAVRRENKTDTVGFVRVLGPDGHDSYVSEWTPRIAHREGRELVPAAVH